MPSIEQLDWNKLQPEIKDRVVYRKEKPKGYLKFEPGTKSKKNKKKLINPPKKKTKAIDKSIWTDNYKYQEHLRSIQAEL